MGIVILDIMKKYDFKTVIMWALTLFMFASAIVFVPSAASVIMLLFAAVAVPLDRVQDFWKSKGLTELLRYVLLAVLFGVAVWLAP